MTLILGVSKADGIYMSADYRLTDLRSGRLVDDTSIKFLRVDYAPLADGPKALLGYTGLATVAGTPTGTWIRETLRGETDETFDRSMTHLRGRLDRDASRARISLTICLLVLHGSRRYVGTISNNVDPGVITDFFEYAMVELQRPTVFGNGSGAARVGADGHLDLLRSQLNVVPRRTVDHMGLLASVNRRVAGIETSVSPFCHVSFINADERSSPQARVFAERGESVPFELPIVVGGIDLSGLARDFQDEARAALDEGTPPDEPSIDEVNRELRRRP